MDLPRTGAGIRDDPTPPRAPAHSSLVGLCRVSRASGSHLPARDHRQRRVRREDHVAPPAGYAAAWRAPRVRGPELPHCSSELFDDPPYVWVTREDKVRQAVSLWRALQTRTWRGEHGRREDAAAGSLPLRGHRPPGARRCAARTTPGSSYFAGNGIEALRSPTRLSSSATRRRRCDPCSSTSASHAAGAAGAPARSCSVRPTPFRRVGGRVPSRRGSAQRGAGQPRFCR